MPLAQQILLNIPSFLLCLIVVGGFTAFSIGGLLLVRRFVPHSALKDHHDVADPILGALGALYAVLLAFVVVTVWQSFDKSDSNVEQEANYVADIYRDSEAFSPDFHRQVGDLLREYRQGVIEEEWDSMKRGQMSPRVEDTVRRIWALYVAYQPGNSTEQSFFDESVRNLDAFRDLRRQRVMDSKRGIHPLLWFVMLLGGVVTIAFTFFFGAKSLMAQTLMAALLSIVISLILFTILSLDFPFTGGVSISPAAFKEILLD